MRTPAYHHLTNLLLIAALAITAAIYYPGLNGSFALDDHSNILNNPLLAITSLAPEQLYQAWNSSLYPFPASRPLSMLTFGINHAFTNLDPYWFKVTNLLIHLLCGAALFQLTRIAARLYARINGIHLTTCQLQGWALITATIWLLHPLNLTPALYIVQRMTSLSALFSLLAMITYIHGRTQLLDGKGGVSAMLLATPFLGSLAFMSKENGMLLPGFLFVLELTLFRFKTHTPKGLRFLQLYFLLGLALPIIAGTIYILLHPQWLGSGYLSRPFTLPERLMSEARIIWFYLQMIFRPDNALLGLYHDDFIISRSLLAPLTTLFAILGIIGLITLAFWQRKNAPIMAFGILFFLVGHSLESSIIPLELIFEHRNYLPSAGLFIALIYYLVVAPTRRRLRYCTIASAILFIVICASNTAFRAQDWANPTTMIMAEVKHHPNSPRANFAAANVLAGTILNTVDSKEKETLYPLARHFFTQSVNLNREAAFGLLGLIILDLHMDKPVEQRLLDDLKYRLEHVRYSAYNFGTGVLYHLIRIHLSGEQKLPPKELLSITNAALRNQTLDKYTQAGINAGLRSYHLMVLNDPKLALKHGYEAIKARPQNVQYRISLIRILLNMGEINQARQQLHLTREADRNQLYTQQTQALEREIERVLQAE